MKPSLNIRICSVLCALCTGAAMLSGCAVHRTDVPADSTDAASTAAETTETVTEAVTDAMPPDTDAPDTNPPDTNPPDTDPPETESAEISATEAPVIPEPPVIPDPPEPSGGSAVSVGTSATGMKIEVVNGVTYVGGVLVANKTYSLPDSYYPGGLTDETYAAFSAMISAAAADGFTLYCKSGFRSYIDQKIIYNDYAARDGQALADTYSARPGHSEHQSGMALDINSTSSDFAYTPEGKWLAENCWDYGFIIRYPADKVEITGYMYEPWHVRYVGKTVAAELKASGQCLEEYLGITSEYAY